MARTATRLRPDRGMVVRDHDTFIPAHDMRGFGRDSMMAGRETL
jgi:hypothetical protein